ncbi:MAG: DMT family transporter [Candidatus Symbiothrix sp.]|jgi:drug/metabolite transporter (DMT)-like permease|nr:DMT family transporter [Candidatus Symbiothrix sp.]
MENNKVSYKIYIQVILANVFWGFSFVWTDIVLKSGIAPITLVSARMIIATILLGAWAKYTGNLQKIKFKHLKYFLGLAMCEPFLYFLCETYGQTMVSPTVTSVIVATIPLFTPVVGFLILKEKITWSTILGIVVSMLGVFVVVFIGSNDLSGQVFGAVLVFGAVISALGYAVFVKYLVHRYNATTLVFYQNFIGLIYFIPCFFIVDFSSIGDMKFTFDAVSSIIQLSVFASVIAFIFYSRSVKVLGVTKAGVFCYIIPVLTALFAFFMVNEQLAIVQWLGMVVVILGLFISQLANKS